MGGYSEWFGTDLYRLLEPLIKGGQLKPTFEGKFEFHISFAYDSAWENIKSRDLNRCLFNFDILFACVSNRTPVDTMFIPLSCQKCWKVVARPKTLKQLFAIRDIQIEMGTPCKCGIEERREVFGLYGAYWYNDSLKEGLECYRVVRDKVDPEIPVLLKRGCTEMEAKCGDSSKWTPFRGQKEVEDYIRNHVIIPPYKGTQPEEYQPHIHRKWVEWAYRNGDETYKEYTEGRPLFKPYVTYHHLLNAKGKEIKEFFNA